MTTTQLKANFAVQNKYEAFYTGGRVEFSKDGEYLFCQCGNRVHVIDVQTGKRHRTVGKEDEDDVTCFGLSQDDKVVVVATKNLQLKQWDWDTSTLTRTWRAIHTGPVSCMSFDVTSTLLATGGADATIKVWDVVKQYCTHNLKGHSGVISVAQFHPDISRLELFTSADDGKVRVWNLQSSTCTAILEAHYSTVTSICFSPDAQSLYSAGRDKVVTVWNLKTHAKTKTVPVYESVESLVLLPKGKTLPKLNITSEEPHFITAGSKGVLRVWNASTAQCVYTQTKEGEKQEKSDEGSEEEHPIVNASYSKALSSINVVTYDHNIELYNVDDLTPKKQFVGYNDDVLDIRFLGAEDSHIAVATNSAVIKVFEVSSWSCQLLKGHTDIVLCLDVYRDGSLMVSGSKDNSLRVWQMDASSRLLQCVAVGQGHTLAVNAVTFPRLKPSFVTSGSQDQTMKVWELPESFPAGEVTVLHSRATEHCHDKDINAVTVAPNDKLVASGSQDRLAKLWKSSDLSLVGVFRGHKRGIWSVQFSPVDQCLATTSADGTIKIWALNDFTCVKTFEGHESSVLKVSFLTRGMQLLSSGSDGLLKLWTIKTSECVKTLDEHDEKVWALACNKREDMVVTGAGDSTIIVWKDVTESELEEQRVKQVDFILKEQELSNLLHQKKFLKAITLAITLDQPFKVLSVMKGVITDGGGEEKLKETICKLREDQIDAILRYSGEWNTNSRHCHMSQFVVNTLLKAFPPTYLLALPNIKTVVEGLMPYTERHFQRTTRLLQQSTFVDYTWQSMRIAAPPKSDENSAKVEDSSSKGYIVDLVGNRKKSASSPKSEDENDSSSDDEDNHSKLPKKQITKKYESSNSSDDDDDSDADDKSNKQKQAGALKSNVSAQSQSDSDSSDDDSTVEMQSKRKEKEPLPKGKVAKDDNSQKTKSPQKSTDDVMIEDVDLMEALNQKAELREALLGDFMDIDMDVSEEETESKANRSMNANKKLNKKSKKSELGADTSHVHSNLEISSNEISNKKRRKTPRKSELGPDTIKNKDSDMPVISNKENSNGIEIKGKHRQDLEDISTISSKKKLIDTPVSTPKQKKKISTPKTEPSKRVKEVTKSPKSKRRRSMAK